MTNRELIAELRKPSDVEMPVLTSTDVVHLIIRKSDLIAILKDFDPEHPAPWDFRETNSHVRRLDVA